MLELAEAVRTVRAHSEEWDIDPQKLSFAVFPQSCAHLWEQSGTACFSKVFW